MVEAWDGGKATESWVDAGIGLTSGWPRLLGPIQGAERNLEHMLCPREIREKDISLENVDEGRCSKQSQQVAGAGRGRGELSGRKGGKGDEYRRVTSTFGGRMGPLPSSSLVIRWAKK